MTTDTTSYREILELAFRLSNLIMDKVDAGVIPEDKVDIDRVCGHADGLVAKRISNIVEGRCSPQASMDFDMEKEFEGILEDLTYFRTVATEAGL